MTAAGCFSSLKLSSWVCQTPNVNSSWTFDLRPMNWTNLKEKTKIWGGMQTAHPRHPGSEPRILIQGFESEPSIRRARDLVHFKTQPLSPPPQPLPRGRERCNPEAYNPTFKHQPSTPIPKLPTKKQKQLTPCNPRHRHAHIRLLILLSILLLILYLILFLLLVSWMYFYCDYHYYC